MAFLHAWMPVSGRFLPSLFSLSFFLSFSVALSVCVCVCLCLFFARLFAPWWAGGRGFHLPDVAVPSMPIFIDGICSPMRFLILILALVPCVNTKRARPLGKKCHTWSGFYGDHGVASTTTLGRAAVAESPWSRPWPE
jgi:hypothetical protein